MKRLKVLLGTLMLFLLVACGAKNDNGTYTYSKARGDSTYTVIITIHDSTGSLTFETRDKNGETSSDEQGLTVDQKRKTLTAERDSSTVDYEIEGEVLRLKNTHDSTLENAEFTKE